MKGSEERYIFENGHFEIVDTVRDIFYSGNGGPFEEVVSRREDGSVMLCQHRVQGRLHGPSRSFFASGALATERWFVDDVAHGRALDFTPLKVLIFKAAYRHGQFHGSFERHYPNGSLFMSGAFLDGRPDGLFVVYDKDGLILRSTMFVDGRRDGIEYAWTDENYALFCERWVRGERVSTIIPDPLLRRA